LFEVGDNTDWRLSKRFIEATKKLNLSTIRFGGLGANPVKNENMLLDSQFSAQTYENSLGSVSGSVLTNLNQFLTLNYLTGANPQYVISQRNTMADNEDFLEYMYGDESTEYGAMREAMGYPSWEGKFENIFYELGNELLCFDPSDGHGWEFIPGAGGCPGDNSTGRTVRAAYADWSTERINLYKDPSKNPDADKTKVGFNVWTITGRLYHIVQTLQEERNNAGGGNADFFLVQGYQSSGSSTPSTFFNYIFGLAAFS
jgi:hypothetical protein